MARKSFRRKGVLISVNKLVFAKLTLDEEEILTYAADVYRAPGVIEIAMTKNLTDEALGADNNPIWEQMTGLDSIDVAVNLGTIAKEGEAYLMGHQIDSNGALVYSLEDIAPWVAMGFEAEATDGSLDYIWLFKGKFKPSDETYHTRERGTVNWNTPNIAATFGPLDHNGQIYTKLNTKDEDVTQATADAFFEAPYTPTFTTPPTP